MIGNHQASDPEKIWLRMVRKEKDNSSLDGGVRCETVSNQLKSMLANMNDFKNLCLCSFLFVGKTFDEQIHEP